MSQEVNVKLDTSFNLNENLIKTKKLNNDDIIEIKRLHQIRIMIEEAMALESDAKKLCQFNFLWMEYQRQLQLAWKFEQDDKYIAFWTVPGCSCPKMDNNERWPTGYYIVNNSCKVHGI